MSIATLPPSNHVQALRAFINRVRRTRAMPTQQKFAQAEESLAEMEKAVTGLNSTASTSVLGG
jgi:hypothetical protein